MDQVIEFIGNHAILAGTFAILLALFVRNEMGRGGRTVTSQELVNLVNRENALVLDVRDAREFADGHIVDSVNIPHAAVASRVSELERYKGRPVAIVCKMGQHAGSAGTVLRREGFEPVMRLTGGMTEWRNQNLPVVKGKSDKKAKSSRGKGASKGKSRKGQQKPTDSDKNKSTEPLDNGEA
jgi:rhodanese-related sulfurtransferase